MTILPLTYLGSTEWFARLTGGDCVVDVGENWVKQTARNRCEIMTSGGVAALTVPVHGGGDCSGDCGGEGGGFGGRKIATKEVRIDNSKRWQHTHWVSIVSAYRNSPFFDHYEERFAPVYERRFEFLVDLNLELLDILIAAVRLEGAIKISEDYVVPSPGDMDLRGKKALRRVDGSAHGAADKPRFQEYTQVFSDRMPFVPALSIVDLLFCEGPAARSAITTPQRQSHR